MSEYIAVCSKCEKIYPINSRTKEAWCYHTTRVNGEDLHVETITCRIIRKEDKNG